MCLKKTVAKKTTPRKSNTRSRRFQQRAAAIISNTKTDKRTREAVRRALDDAPIAELEAAVINAERGVKLHATGEPRDRLSDAWRHWKIRQFGQGFSSGDLELYDAAWKEFGILLRGLMADENFWHVSNAVALLPHLIIARQTIDRLNLQERRPRAGTKARKGGTR